jgi:uncharacterized membrane protein YdjX (TVP38/TMEM64 family)
MYIEDMRTYMNFYIRMRLCCIPYMFPYTVMGAAQDLNLVAFLAFYNRS